MCRFTLLGAEVQVTAFQVNLEEICPESVGLTNVEGPPAIHVFPNPSTGLVYLDFGEKPVNASLSAFDAQGKLVKQMKLKDSLNTAQPIRSASRIVLDPDFE